MTKSVQRPALWMWLNMLVIVGSAASVFYPPILHMGPAIVLGMALGILYFVLRLLRLKADGTAHSTARQLYARARADGRLPQYPLEGAAVIALLMASIYAKFVQG